MRSVDFYVRRKNPVSAHFTSDTNVRLAYIFSRTCCKCSQQFTADTLCSNFGCTFCVRHKSFLVIKKIKHRNLPLCFIFLTSNPHQRICIYWSFLLILTVFGRRNFWQDFLAIDLLILLFWFLDLIILN